jgi:hypothetical protein
MALDVDSWLVKVAGMLGSCASMLFMKGPISERLLMAVGGTLVAYYAAPWASSRTGLPEGLSGFLLGLFGMTVCSKVWDLLNQTPIADMWASVLDALRSRLGGGRQ